MRPPSTIMTTAAAVVLLVANAALAQRSSPQFSFPPPGPLAGQFGADVFGPGSQDISLNQPNSGQSTLAQTSPLALGLPGQQDQSSPSATSSSSSPSAQSASGLQQPGSLIAQSAAARHSEPQQQQQQPSIQLSRPSLSLTSLTTTQQQQQQQPARQSATAHSSQSSAAVRDPQTHQSSRQQQQSSASRSGSQHHAPAAAAASGASSNHHHQHHHHQPQQHQPQHPSNLQTQQTSQSLNAQNNQAAVESARKAEATAASLAAQSGQNYHCPDSFGFFRHHKSCDKYWACENGTSTLKLCGNGLMFDDSDPKRENCAYPFSVDCGADRTDLEPPISTPHCPRLYGLFADTANCRVFYSCWNGEASKYECPPGLAYDNEQRVCVWADLVDRCDQSEVSDGFVCPDPTEADQPGHYTRHAHPTDCRKFYVCIEGVARPYGCSFGTVFNVDSLQCDEPDNVSGCEKYYGDMDPKLAKKLAREGTQGQPQQQAGPSSRSSSSSSSTSSSSSSSSQANH